MRERFLLKQLGALKWRVTQVWPAGVRGILAKKLRRKYAVQARLLPTTSAPGEALDVEVHMLCGEAQVDMGIWASWSVLRFLPGAAFFLHSDGTIEDRSLATWRRIVPQLEHVAYRDAEEKMHAALAGLPHLSAWRDTHVMARQPIDYFLYGRKAYVLGLDSDVLCFKAPEVIVNAIRNRETGALWMKDSISAYSMPEPEFEKRYGRNAARVNGGFWLAPRFSMADMEGMDRDLCAWAPEWRDSYWSPQTLLAAAFSRSGGSALDPARYMLGLGGQRSGCVLRHYPSPRYHRSRFFTEGIPAVKESARQSKWAIRA